MPGKKVAKSKVSAAPKSAASLPIAPLAAAGAAIVESATGIVVRYTLAISNLTNGVGPAESAAVLSVTMRREAAPALPLNAVTITFTSDARLAAETFPDYVPATGVATATMPLALLTGFLDALGTETRATFAFARYDNGLKLLAFYVRGAT